MYNKKVKHTLGTTHAAFIHMGTLTGFKHISEPSNKLTFLNFVSSDHLSGVYVFVCDLLPALNHTNALLPPGLKVTEDCASTLRHRLRLRHRQY